MSDAILRQRLKQDAGSVLAEEFSKHRDRLWRAVNFRLEAVLNGRVDPDDILQEAWIAASERIQHFLENESMSMFVWLRLIVGQTIVDVQRRHLGAKMRDAYREQSLPSLFSQAGCTSLAFDLLANLTSPSNAAVRDEMAEQLQQAISSMDEIDREILALRHFEELNNSEVAEVLGIHQKAASIRYVRALRRLKLVLEANPGFSERAR